MAHHFTKNTVSASKFCNTCNRETMHYVWDGRLGQCMEHKPKERPTKTDHSAEQQGLDFSSVGDADGGELDPSAPKSAPES